MLLDPKVGSLSYCPMPFGSLSASLVFTIFPWASATDRCQGWDTEPEGPLICPTCLSCSPWCLLYWVRTMYTVIPMLCSLVPWPECCSCSLVGESPLQFHWSPPAVERKGGKKRPFVAFRDLKCLGWCNKNLSDFCNKSQEMYFWKAEAPLTASSRTNFNNHLAKSPKLNFRLKTSRKLNW